MRRGALVLVLLATAMGLSAVAAQEKPLPKPVSPPLPIPGNAPPAAPKSNQPVEVPAGMRLPGIGDEPVAPYVDDQTLLVVRFDLANLDLNAVHDWVLDAVGELRKSEKEIFRATVEVDRELGQAFRWVEDFRAAGAKRFYAVASLADFTEGRPPFLVVPLGSGADAKAVARLLSDSTGLGGASEKPGDAGQAQQTMVAQEIRGAVVYAARGTIDRLKIMHAVADPEQAHAFSSSGPGQILIALAPGEAARKLLEKDWPSLAQALGGGPIEPVSRGLRWGTIAIQLPPNPSLHLLIQARDADSARDLQHIIDRGIHWLDSFTRGPVEMRVYQQLATLLHPQLAGDRLEARLTGEQTRQVAGIIGASLLEARVRQYRAESQDNLRKLASAVLQYAEHHDGQLPRDLGAELDPYLGPNPNLVWTDRLRPNQKKPYVYLRLADRLSQIHVPDQSVLIYENHTTWDNGINVALADGKVQWMGNEKVFNQMLERTKNENPSSVELPQ